MEFEEIKKRVLENAKRYSENHNVEIDKDFSLLKLYEELGEFSQAVLIHDRKSRPEKFVDKEVSHQKMSEELSDVVGMCIVTANVLGIDLEQALKDKWFSREQ